MLRIALRFRDPWHWCYAWMKMRTDPVFPAGFEALQDSSPSLPVLDIGCGMGLFAFYLRERGFAAPVAGVDFDGEKIRRARGVAKRGGYRDVAFTEGDVMTLESAPGHVVIFDVLHYLTPEAQTRLLEHAAGRVSPGGVCLIRATPRDASWRFRVTQWEESFMHTFRWVKTGAVHYPGIDAVSEAFRARGFSVELRPLWGRTPFNSYLFVFRAPEVSSIAE